MNRNDFIEEHFGYANRNIINSVYHNALVILDSDENFNRFKNQYWSLISNRKSYDKLHNSVTLYKFRKDKIKSLNITKDEFLALYQIDPLKALENLFQESVRERHMKGFNRMLGDDSIEIVYDTFSFNKEVRFVSFLTMPFSTRYKLEKESYLRDQKILKKLYLPEEDISPKDLEQYDSFSKRNQSDKTVTISRLVRDSVLAKKLKLLYKHQCQVCNQQLPSYNGFISEAHHIHPYNKTHKGDDTWGNMIVLCPNCHAQFDTLFFAIDPADRTLNCLDENHPFHGKKIIPIEGHELQSIYLEYAWEKYLSIKGNN